MITDKAPRTDCRYCPARAVWATYETTGRRTLVDPDPIPSGNLLLYKGDKGLMARVVPAEQRANSAEMYVSHFATCPGRDRARRSR